MGILRNQGEDMLTKQQLDQYREDIVFEAQLLDRPFVFRSTWGLFSPREVDEGTR